MVPPSSSLAPVVRESRECSPDRCGEPKPPGVAPSGLMARLERHPRNALPRPTYQQLGIFQRSGPVLLNLLCRPAGPR